MTKRALIIEGGGFRAAYAAGAVYHLLKNRPDIHFDVVASNSSSVCTAAYFVTKQLEEMEAIWKGEYLGSPKLMSWRRAPVSFYKSFLNIDYLFDTVFKKNHPLDLEKLRQSPIQFLVTVMEYPTGERVFFSNRDPEIYDAMRASCALPFAYIGKVMIRGKRYIDGFYDSVPLRLAEGEADEIWVISTRPAGYRKTRSRLLANLPHPHFRLLSERYRYYNAVAEKLETDPNLKILRPRRKLPISRLTNNMNEMRTAFEIGEGDMKSFLFISS